MQHATSKNILLIFFLSLGIHVAIFASLHYYQQTHPAAKVKQPPVKVKVITTKKVIEKKAEPKPKEEVKPKPKEEIKPKPKPEQRPKTTTQPKSKKVEPLPASEPPKQVQGLNKNSFSDKGTSGFQAPAGNSLAVPDEGVRQKEVEPIIEDMSSNAKLDLSSFKYPEYTDDALDASIEGSFEVDVFVESSGKVGDAELRKKIGYGMDERLIESIKEATFTPRRDKKGLPISGWTVVKINLEIP